MRLWQLRCLMVSLLIVAYPTGADLVIRVTDGPGGVPRANAEVKTRVNHDRATLRTDDRGEVVLAIADPEVYVRVEAGGDEDVPIAAHWHPTLGNGPVPEQIELPLVKGVPIGGVVVGPEGKPLAGAQVMLSLVGDGSNPGTSFRRKKVRADAAGRWQARFVPANPEGLRIHVQHPDVAPRSFGGIGMSEGSLHADSLHAERAVLRLALGVRVAGRVLDDSGQPVEGARIDVGHGSNGGWHTDAEGRYAARLSAGMFSVASGVAVTVQAAGFAPELVQLQSHEKRDGMKLAVQDIRLKPGHTVQGQVVDGRGEPLVGVRVAAETWRGGRTIDWQTCTDSAGRFVWADAPADEMTFVVLTDGKMVARGVRLIAGDAVNTVTLQDPWVVTGRVTDASTGQPIDAFAVYLGETHRRDASPRFDARQERRFRGGRFEVSFTETDGRKYVAVEAPGYARAVSPAFDPAGAERRGVFDVALQPAPGLKGRVVDADGVAVPQAVVEIIEPNRWPDLTNGLRRGRPEAGQSATTGDGGDFWLHAPKGDYLLLVLHERGIARTSSRAFRKGGEVRLEPWGRIEGEVWDGTQRAAHAVVRGNTFSKGYKSGKATIEIDYRVEADGDGRFVIDRVAPGDSILGREVRDVEAGSSTSVSHARPTLVAGEVLTLKIGGVGRPVRGRVINPDDLPQPRTDSRFETAVQLQPQDPATQKAVGERRLGESLGADGTFVLDDVPAGVYELTYEFGEIHRGWFSRDVRAFFRVSQRVVIPEMPGGVSDDTLDLGDITPEDLREKTLEAAQ